MPECQFCLHPIGQSGLITTNEDSTCGTCGKNFSIKAQVIYKGLYDKNGSLVHRFLVLDVVNCPGCNQDVSVFDAPCGGSYGLALLFEKGEKIYA